MTLSAADRAIYTTRLAEAEAALHQLILGQSAKVFVDQNGERIEYTQSNAGRLRAYISELRVALGKTTVTGPLSVWF
jgi:hypothetical protein